MSAKEEVEVKFRVGSIRALTSRLRAGGFELLTRRTFERNTLYDLPSDTLRRRGALLRVRKYGPVWTVTYKDKGKLGRHKSRREIETQIQDGKALAAIFHALGLGPRFIYEKFRTEWSDGAGRVVIDETPIGDFGEIEGRPIWIDAVAKRLGVGPDQYITASYSELFQEWKRQTGSRARHMLFPAPGRTSWRSGRSR
jgi:adenylate cyclase class 2